MTKADKKDEERKEQLETEALMDAEVEAATDCGPVSHKAEKKDKEKAEQAETEALMDAEVEVATDCGCGCVRTRSRQRSLLSHPQWIRTSRRTRQAVHSVRRCWRADVLPRVYRAPPVPDRLSALQSWYLSSPEWS